MNEPIGDGGPAFPRSITGINAGYREMSTAAGYGMSLRDYFAAAALTGMLATGGSDQGHDSNPKNCARHAYGYADAMLAARGATP